jgi:membrane-associated phospholipid phosphatase
VNRFLFALLFALALLVWLAVYSGIAQPIDRAVLAALRSPPALVPAFDLVTTLGDASLRFVLMAVAMALVWRRLGRGVFFLPAMLLPGMAIVSGLKWLTARPRPDIAPHLDQVVSMSFPSGHAANNMMLYLGIALLIGRGWGVALAAAGLMGWSRLALGVHWPSDVLAGWLIGAGWVLLCATFLPSRWREGIEGWARR